MLQPPPETNGHVIRNTPRQLQRLTAAGIEAINNWERPRMTLYINNRIPNRFKRYKFL